MNIQGQNIWVLGFFIAVIVFIIKTFFGYLKDRFGPKR
jgi:hypothetical protein